MFFHSEIKNNTLKSKDTGVYGAAINAAKRCKSVPRCDSEGPFLSFSEVNISVGDYRAFGANYLHPTSV